MIQRLNRSLKVYFYAPPRTELWKCWPVGTKMLDPNADCTSVEQPAAGNHRQGLVKQMRRNMFTWVRAAGWRNRAGGACCRGKASKHLGRETQAAEQHRHVHFRGLNCVCVITHAPTRASTQLNPTRLNPRGRLGGGGLQGVCGGRGAVHPTPELVKTASSENK